MDLSVFPRGRYYAKQMVVRFKNPYPQKGRTPFALEIRSLNNRGSSEYDTEWDLDAFRPDLRDCEFLHSRLQKGTKAVVLYESVSYTQLERCYKIPRYIVVRTQKNDKWFVNVR